MIEFSTASVPGVEERGLRRAGERRDGDQPLGELDVDLVRDDREVGVREARELLLRGLDHSGCEWPTLRQPTPPVKSMNVLPSTSVSVAPRPSAATIGWTSDNGAAAITRSLRSTISRERGPGSSVRNLD